MQAYTKEDLIKKGGKLFFDSDERLQCKFKNGETVIFWDEEIEKKIENEYKKAHPWRYRFEKLVRRFL